MPALSATDAERLLRFVAEAESVGGDQPFTGELLVELGKLIEADWVTYTEVDHVHRLVLYYLPRPGDEDDEDVDLSAEDWDLMHTHPICERWRHDARFSALRVSDVISQRELRRNPYYNECFRPWGVEYELKVRLPSPPWHARTLMFNRKIGRDFTRRDRRVLELLSPHLTRLWHAARTHRLLAASLAALESPSESEPRGVILLGAADEIEFASASARRLLRAYFPGASGGRLPGNVARWLAAGSAEPLRRRRGNGALVLERSGDVLVVFEERIEIDLTARETEVMGWVAQGKTNSQIAELLWLAPSTVRKHLENVYAKLGVNTRTAAAARFLGSIEAEVS